MAKDPAVLLYTSDFLNGCADLTMEERGQYITLLCLQHQKGHLTEKAIKLSVGNVSKDVMCKFMKDEDGNFYHERMEKEINARDKFCNYQRDRSLKRWSKKGELSPGIPPALPGGIPIYENENEDNKKKKEEGLLRRKEEEEKKRESLVKKEDDFRKVVMGYPYPEKMLRDFCDYWTEKNKSRTKMRYELEKVFEVKRRLVTWASRDKSFKVESNGQITYKELVRRFNEGEIDIWDKYEPVSMGDRRSMWKRKIIN